MKIRVLGTGSWGSALAQTLADNGHDVIMWGIDDAEINDIENRKAMSTNVEKALKEFQEDAEKEESPLATREEIAAKAKA